MLGHEVDNLGGRFLRRDDEIAFVLSVFVVDENEHAALTRVLDHVFDRRQPTWVRVGHATEFLMACGENKGRTFGANGRVGQADLRGRAIAVDVRCLRCKKQEARNVAVKVGEREEASTEL